jgi:hypothetical protein
MGRSFVECQFFPPRRTGAGQHQNEVIGKRAGSLHVNARPGLRNIGHHAAVPLVGGQCDPGCVTQGLTFHFTFFREHWASLPISQTRPGIHNPLTVAVGLDQQ